MPVSDAVDFPNTSASSEVDESTCNVDGALVFAVVSQAYNRMPAPRSAILSAGNHVFPFFVKPGVCPPGLILSRSAFCAQDSLGDLLRLKLSKRRLDARQDSTESRNDTRLDVLKVSHRAASTSCQRVT